MSEKLYTFASEIRTTATQLETLKSKIARHIGLVWSLHLHQRYPAARRDMATPTPQHPYHHHVAASVRYTVRSPPRLVERTQPIARRRCREGAHPRNAEDSRTLRVRCGDGLAGIGWVIIGGLWVGERPQPVGSNPP